MAISRIYRQARETPGKPAVVHDGRSLSYAELAQRIEAARQYLLRRELSPGVAVLCFESLLDVWIVGFALRSIGVTTIASGANEVTTLGVRQVGCILTSESEDGAALTALAAANKWDFVRVPADPEIAVAPVAIAAGPDVTTRPGAHILRTSGTTGAYKMVLRDPVQEERSLAAHAEIYGVSESSCIYVGNFGRWTAGGYRWPLFTWSVGGTVVIHQRLDQHAPLAEHEFTHVFTTPDMLATMLRTSGDALRRNDATRLMVTGGALPATLLAGAPLTRQVFSVLASTEALTVAITPLEEPEDLLWHRVHPSREVEVVDESDRRLPPGKEGQIRIRITDGLAGYLDDEEATREFFRDGYFYPGDLGLIGDDGRLALHGRASDVVNVLGNKVATAPIEQALQDRLGVDAVCIVSIRGKGTDEEIHIVIESTGTIDRGDLEVAAKAELGSIGRAPVHVDIIGKLPRNEMGKVERLVLKQRLIEAREAIRR